MIPARPRTGGRPDARVGVGWRRGSDEKRAASFGKNGTGRWGLGRFRLEVNDVVRCRDEGGRGGHGHRSEGVAPMRTGRTGCEFHQAGTITFVGLRWIEVFARGLRAVRRSGVVVGQRVCALVEVSPFGVGVRRCRFVVARAGRVERGGIPVGAALVVAGLMVRGVDGAVGVRIRIGRVFVMDRVNGIAWGRGLCRRIPVMLMPAARVRCLCSARGIGRASQAMQLAERGGRRRPEQAENHQKSRKHAHHDP